MNASHYAIEQLAMLLAKRDERIAVLLTHQVSLDQRIEELEAELEAGR